ncbi:MAG: chemotaxis protein CheA [bacterium]
MEQFKNKFIDEALDLIQELEKSSLELSSDPTNPEHIEVIFRAMHSLKGGSAMFGFEKIDTFTHQLEAAYDKVRNGELKVSEKLLDLTFQSIDHIKVLLAEDDSLGEGTLKRHSDLLGSIRMLLEEDNVPAEAKDPVDLTENSSEDRKGRSYYISFVPRKDIMKNGTNPLLVINELVTLGENRVFPFTSDIPDYENLEALSCYTGWSVLLYTDSPEEDIRDVFMFVDLDCDLDIRDLGNKNVLDASEFMAKIENAYKAGGKPELKEIEDWAESIMDKPEQPQPSQSKATLVKQKEQRISSIRVSSEKLDELIGLVSELVTRQASLTLISENIHHKELITVAEDIDKITRRLRDSTFNIRLIPVDNMVTRFQRLARELSQELDKEINFLTEGTDTELDKTIIEGLIDPLMHIIRNSIDHGIESAEERKALGKPEKGTIKLKAFYSGANVYLQVSDDGKGMNISRIREKAHELGFIKEAEPTEKELLDMLFLPGFSTAKNVTKVSGRGVGMDVVKRKISDLRGEISIDTEENVGTTMTIKLPLTLSIIDGLLVKIDNTHYVIPLASVDKCYEFKHEQLTSAVNNMIYVDNGHIPFAYLRKEFGIDTPPPDIEQVIAIEYDDMIFGLAVDHVVDEYQAVLTSLGKMFIKQDIISGATILGDGTVALVVDPNRIIKQFNYQAVDSKA